MVSFYSLGVCGKCGILLRFTNSSGIASFIVKNFEGYFCPNCGKKITQEDFGYDENGRKICFPQKRLFGYFLNNMRIAENNTLEGKAFPLCARKLTTMDKIKSRIFKIYPVFNISRVYAVKEGLVFSPLSPELTPKGIMEIFNQPT